ncbi:restriction endonuclease subunit S [Exiguobacterium sp.]|uniref:restriction endonuclease subunit S n=1 Tax=Exiguobacterium sp. TaxID=44751 RepID=UPI00263B3EA6|nr:restriction endonuclease subunit S [Exiguobacterium sp.]MCC5893813.1 restriction endonuclease subunit S [Exiguobacterium sp.]
MSKSRKKINELVEELCLPLNDHPFQIPNNWIFVNLGQVVTINPTKPKLEVPDEQYCSFLPMGMVSAKKGRIERLEEREFQKVKKGYTYFEENDVLFAKITPCMENGNVVIAKDLKNKFGFGSTEFHVLRATKAVDENYLFYLLRTESFRKQAKIKMTGAVGQQRVPKKYLEVYPLPLPPLKEQKRIVEKIEQLLCKLDQIEEILEEVQEASTLRRDALLKKAFRGELHKVKGEHYSIIGNQDSLPSKWEWRTFGEVAKVNSNLVDPSLYQEFPHIAPDNIRKYTGELLNYQTIQESQVKSPKHYFYKEQILYSKIRPYLSKVIIAPFEGLCSADMYPINTCLETKYLYWYMLSPVFVEKASTAGSRSVLPKINQKELSRIPVPVPPIEEQKQVVNKIEKMLHKEREVLKLIKDTTLKLEGIRESILIRAFRGKLGTNDGVENHTIEILKQEFEIKIK